MEHRANDDIMPASTLGDLAEQGFRLVVACRNCGHLRSVAPASLLARIDRGRHWTSLRFRCTRCGSRDALHGIDSDGQAR
jgi:hypothetical protein